MQVQQYKNYTYIHTYTAALHIYTTYLLTYYLHTYVHTHTHTHTHTQAHIHTHAQMYVCMYARTHTHTHTRTHTHTHTHTYVHTYTHTHTHTHTYTHTHTQTHTHQQKESTDTGGIAYVLDTHMYVQYRKSKTGIASICNKALNIRLAIKMNKNFFNFPIHISTKNIRICRRNTYSQ